MNTIKSWFCLVSAVVGFAVLAADGQENDRIVFGKWRIAVGGALNSPVSASLKARNLPVPVMYRVPAGSTRADAAARAAARQYDGNGFIAADSLDNGFDTENWQLPVANYEGDGRFTLNNAYQEIIASALQQNTRDSSSDRWQFGISAEISRELWIHDEQDEHRWGIDFAFAISYFFQRGVYSANGQVVRSDEVRDGSIATVVNDPYAMWDYDHGMDSPINNMYGYANYIATFMHPALGYDGISTPYDAGGNVRTVRSSLGWSANGDYQELEMLFMLRPWYELADWWRIYAQIGVGVSWGRFDTSYRTSGSSSDEDFSQWDVYGAAGVGMIFRYDRYDLSVDALGRFLRDDFEVNGEHVRGSLQRADWGVRVMVGYEF